MNELISYWFNSDTFIKILILSYYFIFTLRFKVRILESLIDTEIRSLSRDQYRWILWTLSTISVPLPPVPSWWYGLMKCFDTSDSFDTFGIFRVDFTDWLDSDSFIDAFGIFGSYFDTYNAWLEFDPVWIPAVSDLILLKMWAKIISSGDHFLLQTLAFQRWNGGTFFWYLFPYR